MNYELNKSSLFLLLPVFFCFAVMGFIDIAGVATSYVKQDFGLSDRMANLLPGMTMIWFVLISLPTAALMHRIGRKNTVLLSLGVMLAALLTPLAGYSFPVILTAFALLGIGNTILQVSLNPLLKNIVSEGRMTSSLTFGQFVKAIVSLSGPILIGLAASRLGDWTLVLTAYAGAMLLAAVWLGAAPIPREAPESAGGSWRSVFALLRDRYLLICFGCIVLIVGFEICLMTVTPKLLSASFGLPLEESGLGCSMYYAAKTAGAFAGALLLTRIAPARFLRASLAVLAAAFLAFCFAGSAGAVFALLAVIGLAGANVFSIVFALALEHRPDAANDISALLITGIAGGAVLPPVMGIAADAAGLQASLAIPAAAVVLILAAALGCLRTNVLKKH